MIWGVSELAGLGNPTLNAQNAFKMGHPAMKPEQAIKPPQQEIAPVIEHSFDMGHSL